MCYQIYVAALTMLIACQVNSTWAAEPAANRNLAAGAKYECVTKPNYWGWKQPRHGDRGQLNDGKIVTSWNTGQGAFYSLPSSMGFSRADPVILFDLGKVQSIGGVGMHTVLSPWGPWWPTTVTVLVSDDNHNFRLAGQPVKVTPQQLDPPVSADVVRAAIDRVLAKRGLGPSTHWYRTGELRARGRYVAVIMTLPPDTGTIVLDELEIYAGPAELPADRQSGPVFTEGKAGWKSYRLYRAMEKRIASDIHALRGKIENSSVAKPRRTALLSSLDQLQQKRARMAVPKIAGFQAVLPISELHREVFQIHSALWRAQGAPLLKIWKNHRWDPLTPLEQPRGAEPKIRIVMARGAVRSDVLNLSSAARRPVTVLLKLADFPVGHVDLFRVPLVDTRTMQPVASALVPLKLTDGFYPIEIPSGMTVQIWIRCRSHDLAAGLYRGSIQLARQGKQRPVATVPVEIEVSAVQLPDRLSLALGGWDYSSSLSYQVTQENVGQFVAMLRNYGVNVTWSNSEVIPLGQFDGQGNLSGTPSRAAMDRWLGQWPDAKYYCITMGGLGPLASPDVPYRDKKVIAWIRDWTGYLESRGISPDQLAILIRDEPTSDAELKLILRTAMFIRRAEPRIKIWNDLHFGDPTKASPLIGQVMRQACDVQCLNVRHYLQNPRPNDAFMKAHRRADLQWWCYTGGGGHRLTDPYVAWLLRSWFCFDKGLSGAHFWAFGDGHGGFSWNEYFNNGPTRSPLYLAKGSITAGKSLEAMREGAQDFELLQMLKRHLKKQGSQDPAAKAARRALQQDVQRVLSPHREESWPWNTPKDRSAADQVRIKILRQLR